MEKQQIYLTGFMGTGKSTVAACLQKNYKMKQVDMDIRIAEEVGMTIPEIFREKGEEYFRNLETDLLKRLSDEERVVVSCGGGTVMRACNVEEMKRHGKIVLLLASPETVYNRVKNFHNRPLLEGNMNVEYIKNLMDARMPKYEAAADILVKTDGRSAEDICREIMGKRKVVL